MMGRMDDWMDGRMNDETDGWNDASRHPLPYVILREPYSGRVFLRHQEHNMKHHGLGDLSMTKQYKTMHHKHTGPANR